MSYAFTERQLATVLAALRYWQRDVDEGAFEYGSEFYEGIEPLTSEEIDSLCEELNEVSPAPRNDRLVCEKCGSPEVLADAYININDPTDVSMYDDRYCRSCDREVGTVTEREWRIYSMTAHDLEDGRQFRSLTTQSVLRRTLFGFSRPVDVLNDLDVNNLETQESLP